jgi:HEAT repeat protein
VCSLEWLVDSCDVIVAVEVVQAGDRKAARTDAVLKATAQPRSSDQQRAAVDKLVAELPRGRRLLVFGRVGKDQALTVRHAIWMSADEPKRARSLEDARYAVLFGLLLKDATASRVCAALTNDGKLLTEPEQVVRRVQRRVAEGSRVPADCDRERVERPHGGDYYGGAHFCPGTPFDSNELILHVLTPFEPRDEVTVRRWLRRARGAERVAAARMLANFRSPETVAALKTCLDDDYVTTHEERGVRVRCFAVREAAYESLCRLGVHVPQPQLTPK